MFFSASSDCFLKPGGKAGPIIGLKEKEIHYFRKKVILQNKPQLFDNFINFNL